MFGPRGGSVTPGVERALAEGAATWAGDMGRRKAAERLHDRAGIKVSHTAATPETPATGRRIMEREREKEEGPEPGSASCAAA